jgi:hypothetical protein
MPPFQPALFNSFLNLAFKSSVTTDNSQVRKQSSGPNSDDPFFDDPEDYAAEAADACHDELPEFDEDDNLIIHDENILVKEVPRIKWAKDSFSNSANKRSANGFDFGLIFVLINLLL